MSKKITDNALIGAIISFVLVLTAGVQVSYAASTSSSEAGSGAGAQSNLSSPPPVGGSIDDYKLGPGDQVRITVYGDKDLTGEFFVSGSGKISFPLIGEVDAGGHTNRELQQMLTAKLADGYLVDPRVSSEVLVFRPYYILGEVNKPGQYPYENGLTALKAIATGQGYTYRANTKRIYIRHSGDTVEHEFSMSGVVNIQPGDTIRVVERYF